MPGALILARAVDDEAFSKEYFGTPDGLAWEIPRREYEQNILVGKFSVSLRRSCAVTAAGLFFPFKA
jgi:hypothetical protein